MLFLDILLQFLALILVLVGFMFMFIIFLGPPFVPTPLSIIKELIQIANISKKDVVIDLGSGDGRMLIYAARQGAIAKGCHKPVLFSMVANRLKGQGVRGSLLLPL